VLFAIAEVGICIGIVSFDIEFVIVICQAISYYMYIDFDNDFYLWMIQPWTLIYALLVNLYG